MKQMEVMYSTLQIQGIKQMRLRLNKTRLVLRLSAFSRACERVSRLQYTFSV